MFAYILLSPLSLGAQKHDYVWLMGQNSQTDPTYAGVTIDFHTVPPDIYYEFRDMLLRQAIASSCKDTPFVFLTAKGLKEDQIKGYRLGASDYLVKPFDPEILLLKTNVLLRNTGQGAQAKQVYQIGSYAFDSERRTLSLQGAEQRLSPKEAELLQLLCERQNEVLRHEEALLKIWQNDDYFTKQSMNVFITKLRKYLADDPAYRIEIENLHGKGFILKQEALA